jgi:hypothetical protein
MQDRADTTVLLQGDLAHQKRALPAQVKPESRLRRRGASLIGNVDAQKQLLRDIPILEELRGER